MTFVAEGNLGGTAVKRNEAADATVTTAINPSATVAAGQIIVVWFTADATFDAGNPGHSSLYERMACHDSQDNVYSTVLGFTGSNSNSDMMGALFVTRVARALATTDTITVTHRAVAGGGSSAMSVEEFSCDSTLRWAICDRKNGFTESGADPQACTISSLDSRPYLLLHLLGAEGPDTDTYTWDADYTEITGFGTTGGAVTDNVHLRGGYRIATLTTDTVDVTSDTADRDYVQLIVALTEVNYESEFPLEPVLDDFNRADEDPCSRGGDWRTDDSAGPSGPTPSLLEVVSNQAAGSGGSWYADEVYQDSDGEVFVTIATKGEAHVTFGGSGAAENSTVDGLAALWNLTGGVQIADGIILGGAGLAGGTDQEQLLAWVDCADGVKFGMQLRNPQSHLWVDTGSGWEWVGAFHANTSLAPFANGGMLGLGAHDTTVRLDDFGGGPMWKPSIYRRL